MHYIVCRLRFHSISHFFFSFYRRSCKSENRFSLVDIEYNIFHNKIFKKL
nr:MAG TPA: hypothetical protein [Caudoviricetes sp.]